MANNAKVMSSIKDFLLKMKACDADIPEELAEDACEMVEGVKDALTEEEEVKDADVIEEEEVKDEEAVTKEELSKVVEDSINRTLRNLGLIRDSAMSSLDELENKLGEEDVNDEMNEEEVTVDPEKMNDSMKRELIRRVKPVIASVKDARSRRILSDNFAKALGMSSATTSQYGTIMDITRGYAKDSRENVNIKVDSDRDFGMEIAKKFNPHYKEV